jgi:DNA-binding NarL/FixJ family response regulator
MNMPESYDKTARPVRGAATGNANSVIEQGDAWRVTTARRDLRVYKSDRFRDGPKFILTRVRAARRMLRTPLRMSEKKYMAPQVFTRIAIVSDDRLLCDALVQIISEQPDFSASVCDVRADGSFPRAARACDLVLVDARSDPPAVAALSEHPVVVFVGATEDDVWATAALSAGARGILTRTASRDDVVGAIRVVRGGGIWARRRWLNQCILHVVGASKQRLATQDAVETRLSRREREVLQHAATGVCNKELAGRLSISEATVKVHMTRIFQKLGVPGRAALAAAYHDVGPMGPIVRVPPAESSTTNGVIP